MDTNQRYALLQSGLYGSTLDPSMFFFPSISAPISAPFYTNHLGGESTTGALFTTPSKDTAVSQQLDFSPSAAAAGPTPSPSPSPSPSPPNPGQSTTATMAWSTSGTPVSFTLEDRMLLRLVYVQQKALQGQLETLLAASLSAASGLGSTFPPAGAAAPPLFHVPAGFRGGAAGGSPDAVWLHPSNGETGKTMGRPSAAGPSHSSHGSSFPSAGPREPREDAFIHLNAAAEVRGDGARDVSSDPLQGVAAALEKKRVEGVEVRDQKLGTAQGNLRTPAELDAPSQPTPNPQYGQHSRSSSRSGSSLLDWGGDGAGNPLLGSCTTLTSKRQRISAPPIAAPAVAEAAAAASSSSQPLLGPSSSATTPTSIHSHHRSAETNLTSTTTTSTSTNTTAACHEPHYAVVSHRSPSTTSSNHSHRHSPAHLRHVDPNIATCDPAVSSGVEHPLNGSSPSCRPATCLPTPSRGRPVEQGGNLLRSSSSSGAGSGGASELVEEPSQQQCPAAVGRQAEAPIRRSTVAPRIAPPHRKEEGLHLGNVAAPEPHPGKARMTGVEDGDAGRNHEDEGSYGSAEQRYPEGRDAAVPLQPITREKRHHHHHHHHRKSSGVKSSWSGLDCLSDVSFDTQEYLRTNGLHI